MKTIIRRCGAALATMVLLGGCQGRGADVPWYAGIMWIRGYTPPGG